jgi:hypothetical protein
MSETSKLQKEYNFEKCPACGTVSGLAGQIEAELKAAKKIPDDAKFAMSLIQAPFRNPKAPPVFGQKYPIAKAMLEVCTNCGAIYAIHAEVGEMSYELSAPQVRRFGANPGFGQG